MGTTSQFTRHCQAKNLKPTAERLHIVRLVFARAPIPFYPDEIAESCSKNFVRVSRSTIWRTLQLLVSFGMLLLLNDGAFVNHYHLDRKDLA